jgi:hypothetical protein
MVVQLFIEWDNPIEEERMVKYRDFSRGSTFWSDQVKKGAVERYSTWADTTNSRHIVALFEFNSWVKLADVMGARDFQDGARTFSYLVDNLKYRVLRPTVPA